MITHTQFASTLPHAWGLIKQYNTYKQTYTCNSYIFEHAIFIVLDQPCMHIDRSIGTPLLPPRGQHYYRCHILFLLLASHDHHAQRTCSTSLPPPC